VAARHVHILKWKQQAEYGDLGVHDTMKVQEVHGYTHDDVRTVVCVSNCGMYLATGNDTSKTSYNMLPDIYHALVVYKFDKKTRKFIIKCTLVPKVPPCITVQHLRFGGPGNKFLLASSNNFITPVVLWNHEDLTEIIIPLRSLRDTDYFGSIFCGKDDTDVITVLYSNFEKKKDTILLKHNISWLFQEAKLNKWLNLYMQFVLQWPEPLCHILLEYVGVSWMDITCPSLVRSLL